MKNKRGLAILVFQLMLLVLLRDHTVTAQVLRGWSEPVLLSNSQRKASEAYSVADQYGFAHFFWTEEMDDSRVIIQYARFDGQTWSMPIDIRVTEPFRTIGNVSPIVDRNGILHIVWSESDSGPAYYKSVPVFGATSVQNWQETILLKAPAKRIKLQISDDGFLHVVYERFSGTEAGIYYIRSDNGGIGWTEPKWLDPDILPNYGPRSLSFEMDQNGGLHVLWYYVPQDDAGGDWVRYTHSLDGGETWSQPFTIDRIEDNVSDTEKQLSAAGPLLAIQGESVHVIWAGGKLNYRNHRFSTDSGQTWSAPSRIFGDLNGQAGDGFAVDGDGRIHYFGQIRFPMGIYHAVWDHGQWSKPSLIYLIRNEPTDPIIDKVEAHGTNPVIRAGNQIILAFTDPPPDTKRRLFYMAYTLDNVTPSVISPTPVPTIEPLPTITPNSQLVTTTDPRSFDDGSSSGTTSTPGGPLLFGFVSTVVLVGSTVFIVRVSKVKK